VVVVAAAALPVMLCLASNASAWRLQIGGL